MNSLKELMIGTSKGWTQFLQSRGMFTKVVLFAYSIMLTVNGCWALCISEQKIFSLDSEFARSDQIHVALLFPNPAFYYDFITPLFFLKEQFLTFIPVVFIWYISRSSNPLFLRVWKWILITSLGGESEKLKKGQVFLKEGRGVGAAGSFPT